jgi:hypothetical protein
MARSYRLTSLLPLDRFDQRINTDGDPGIGRRRSKSPLEEKNPLPEMGKSFAILRKW